MNNSKQAEQLIDTLYDKMRNKMMGYALAILGDFGLAEDAVQEAFLVAFARADSVKASNNPEGWICNALKNVIKRSQRLRSQIINNVVYVSPDVLSQIASDKNIPDDNVDLLYNDLLDKKEYILLKKFALEKRSIREMADEEGISVNACKERIYRAKLKLRQLIDNEKT